MRLKTFFSVITLGVLSAACIGVGLASNKAPIEAKADADTWMVNFSLDAKEMIGYDGFDFGSMKAHTFTNGVGNDKYFDMYPISAGSQYFQVNATFPDGYTYDRVQFKFMQGAAEKWSTPYSVSGSKASHPAQVWANFGESWSGDNWDIDLGTQTDLYFKDGDTTYDFEPDVAAKRFIASNVIVDGSKYYTLRYHQSWDFAGPTLTDEGKTAFTNVQTAWCSIKAGTYDFILKNNNDDGGVITVKKYDSAFVSVYLVNLAEDAYIYTYGDGGYEGYGSFPGKQLSTLRDTDKKAHEVEGELKFQGNDWPIWRLDLDIGYPTADHLIVHYDDTDTQTANMLLVEGSAYWWSDDDNYHNDNAGAAIAFLLDAEEIRLAATDDSICNISKSDAEDLVDRYNKLSDDVRHTYIDTTTVNTYKRDKTPGTEDVNYKDIMGQLGIIAEMDVAAAMMMPTSNSASNYLTVVIVFVGAGLVFGIAVIAAKKKKEK